MSRLALRQLQVRRTKVVASNTKVPSEARHPEEHRTATVYDDGYLRVEPENYYVACGGKRVSLPLKEFLIFSRLASNADRIVPSEEIWPYGWGSAIQFIEPACTYPPPQENLSALRSSH